MTDRFDICRPMPAQTIKISGARQHNLKNLHVEIPREKLVVITGLSGSGKSSLAFDTLYAEGQRRYVESLSAYARQFLDQMEKPDVDFIEGLSPAIAIEQRSAGANPRSTIATTTEIFDYLRVLFSAVGQPHDPHDGPADSSADAAADRRSNSRLPGGNQNHPARAAPSEPEGRIPRCDRESEARRIRPDPDRWRNRRARETGADSTEESRTTHDRGGGGSAGYSRRGADAAGGFGGDGAEVGWEPDCRSATGGKRAT